ncbi:MAG: universal stress protein [Planctomycetota bacterium]
MKRILIATDGSNTAEEAARFLAQLPLGERLRVDVVSVLQETKSFHRDAPESWIRESFEAQSEALTRSFHRIKACFDERDVEFEYHLCSGHAGKEVVALGEANETDLVVVGAKGHSGLGRMLLGSTSDYIARHAASSVLVVRPSAPRSVERMRIAIAVDGEQPSRDAVAEFNQIHWREGTTVDLITALRTFIGPFGRVEPDAQHLSQATSHLEHAKASLARECETNIIQGEHIAESIVQAIQQRCTDLVFLGEHDRSAYDRFLMGSVSTFVLRHASCSVWISRTANAAPTLAHTTEMARVN